MTDDSRVLDGAAITGRGRSVNPFVVLRDAGRFLEFAEHVFGAREVADARTATPTGALIHAELRLGDSLLLVADTQEGWAPRPGLLQVWVSDLRTVVRLAVARGSVLVTPPTPFYGSVTLARVEDPWGNLWWLYQPVPGQPDPTPVWEGGPDTVFRTLDEHLRQPG